jgi:tricarballylate dehydrogenase
MTLPEHADVVVVGGGHAGLCAAITAAEGGREVWLLERAPAAMRGGNTRHTRNLRAMHEQEIAGLTGRYSAEEYWQDLLRVTDGNTNETLAQLTIRESESLLDWLQAHGVYFQPSLSGTLSLGRTNAFFLGGGCALTNALYLAADQASVKVAYDCHVTGVQMSANTCEAVLIEYHGEQHRLAANTFIMACGGFQANADWMRQAWGEAADNFLIRGTPYNEGHMLQALMQQGVATTGDPTQCHAVAIDARAPKYDGGIVSRLDCVPFSIVVNKHGKRFYDEGEDFWPKRYAIWGRLIAAQPEQIGYAVIDSKVTENFMPSVFPAIEADSLDALAELVEIPGDALQNTVAAYNEAVEPGDYDPNVLDTCCTNGLAPDKTHWALPIDNPPFYAYPLRPGITFTYLGLVVDERARVQMADGEACTNLYAAGEIMAGNILGQGYCAGTGMTIGGVFGRIAGEQAACRPQ